MTTARQSRLRYAIVVCAAVVAAVFVAGSTHAAGLESSAGDGDSGAFSWASGATRSASSCPS